MLVTFYVGGEPYRLTIHRDEEELIRKAAKQVDQRFALYCDKFEDATLNPAKVMSMVAFHFAYEALLVINANETKIAETRIERIIGDIDSFFVED